MKNMIMMALMVTVTAFAQKKEISSNNNLETITLGGGCFWCVEAIYENLDGVIYCCIGFFRWYYC